MRILHIAPRLSSRGGADQYWLNLLRELSSFEQRVVVGAVDGTAEIHCPLSVEKGLAARGDRAVDLCDAMAWRPDVIHVHNVVNPWVLRWAQGKPALFTVQDHRFFCPGRGKWKASGERCCEPMGLGVGRDGSVCEGCFDDDAYFEGISLLTRQRLDALRSLRVTVLSDYMHRELVALGLEADGISVIPPFVADWPAGEAEAACVLFAGRLVESKGVFDVLAAYERSELPWPLVFAGTGSARDAIERAGARVLGWLDRPALARWLRGAKVLVMPSRWQEPFGIIGLEALSLGTPVAAWESGGVAEWHPGGKGLVPWGDVDALANAMVSLAHAGPALPAPGFEKEALVGQFVSLYQALAG